MFRRVAFAVFSAGLLATSACAPITSYSGFQAIDASPKDVKVGEDTKSTVRGRLGSPSTTATVGGEAFYYISQRAERSVAFLDHKVTSQKVLVVYFDDKARVKEVANYGLQDGKVFDFIGRKTKTTGNDMGLLSQILKAAPVNPLAGAN